MFDRPGSLEPRMVSVLAKKDLSDESMTFVVSYRSFLCHANATIANIFYSASAFFKLLVDPASLARSYSRPEQSSQPLLTSPKHTIDNEDNSQTRSLQ